MHGTSYTKMKYFKNTYLNPNENLKILDIGSFDKSGEFNYGLLFNCEKWTYVGLDLQAGNNVDIVIEDPYSWKAIEDETYDVIVSGQAFEHIEFFWLTLDEINRVLKPGGLICIIAPSSGPVHRHPYDCWRFTDNGMKSLAKYLSYYVLESGTNKEDTNAWHDSFVIAKKPSLNLKNDLNNKMHQIENQINSISANNITNENNPLLEEINSLRKEITKLKAEKSNSLPEKYRELHGRHTGFCRYEYLNEFLSDDFEDNLKEVTKHLNHESRYFYKWLLIRNIASSLVTRESIYSKLELQDQEKTLDYRNNHTSKGQVGEYKFTGGYNLHPFVDLNLNDEDLEFIKDKDIIDAGAYTGDTSIPLAKITSRNIYAFEPFEESLDLLKKNIEDNNIKNIIPINKTLGSKNGEQSIFLSGNNVQGITTDPTKNHDKELKIQETTIDKFVEDNDLNIGFITVDVEGAEMELLKGAENTLKTQKPILSISIYHKLSDFFEIIPWIANLDLGYEFEVVKENPWHFFADTSVQCRARK